MRLPVLADRLWCRLHLDRLAGGRQADYVIREDMLAHPDTVRSFRWIRWLLVAETAVGLAAIVVAGCQGGEQTPAPSAGPPAQQSTPTAAVAKAGDPRGQIFIDKGCVQCHKVSKLGVPGQEIGPDLSFAASDVRSRFGTDLESFLKNPTGTMQIVLSSQIKLSEEEREGALPSTLERFTENTVTDRAELERELALARELGYARCHGEDAALTNGVSSAVLDARRRPIAVVNVWGPERRIPEDRLDALGPLAVAATLRIGELLA